MWNPLHVNVGLFQILIYWFHILIYCNINIIDEDVESSRSEYGIVPKSNLWVPHCHLLYFKTVDENVEPSRFQCGIVSKSNLCVPHSHLLNCHYSRRGDGTI